VKLIDFGVAKSTARDDGLTRRGIVGKADWLAPESFHDAKLDRRADIYTLGLVYWYMLTRRDPGITQSNRTSSNDRFVAPSTFNPEVKSDLDSVVAKAIDPDPNLRFQNAAELSRAVARYVPEGFVGRAEVANLIFRNTSRLGDNLLPRLLAEGRPLFDDALLPKHVVIDNTVTEPGMPLIRSEELVPVPRTNWRRVVPLSIGAATILGMTLFFLFRGSETVELPVVRPTAIPVPSTIAPTPTKPSPPVTAPNPPKPTPVETVVSRPEATSRSPEPPVHKPAITRPEVVAERPSPQQTPNEILIEAQESFERSELSDALSLAKLAVERGAGAPAFVLIGSCLSIKKDYAGARNAFKQALRLSPNNAAAKRLLERLQRETSDDSP